MSDEKYVDEKAREFIKRLNEINPKMEYFGTPIHEKMMRWFVKQVISDVKGK